MALVFATRLPFLAATLEDLDSVNFDMGVHGFDPSQHRPHPPGYAIFIGLAKISHAVIPEHGPALALISAMASALALIPVFLLGRRLVGEAPAWLGTVMLAVAPIYWINSVRPMSDLTGFAVAVTAQCLLVAALSPLRGGRAATVAWYAGTVLAGLAVGTRLQSVVLVGPVLAVGLLLRRRGWLSTPATFAGAVTTWLVPTMIASGGAGVYWTKQVEVVAEALPSEPLLSDFTLSRAWTSLTDTFVSPWGTAWLAVPVLAAAAWGLWRLWRDDRRASLLLLLLFGPYAAYNVLLQATIAGRYTVPVLPLLTLLAAVALARLAEDRPGRLVGCAFVVVSAGTAVTAPALFAYRGPSPPAQAAAYLGTLAGRDNPIVVAGHHLFARYTTELPAGVTRLGMPDHDEFRVLNRYWLEGGQAPIWFLRDRVCTTLSRIDPAAWIPIERWRWPAVLQRLVRGARPADVELVRIDPPAWFADTGFMPGIEMGPTESIADEPHQLFVRGDIGATLAISGYAPGSRHVTVVIDGEPAASWRVAGHFTVAVPLQPVPNQEYRPVRLDVDGSMWLLGATLPAADTGLVGPLNGLYDTEYDEQGAPFQWMSRRAELLVVGADRARGLTITGRVTPQDFDAPPDRLQISVDGAAPVALPLPPRDFEVTLPLPDLPAGKPVRVALESSQSFVPDATRFNGDKRDLAIRIYGLGLTPP